MKTTTTASAFRCSLVWLGLFAALFCAVLLLCAAKADAASVVASGDCGKDGDNVKWVLDSDSVLTISGKGEMKDFIADDVPWDNYNIKKVIIKNGVTSIGDQAFEECSSLISVTIPDSVTNIGFGVFWGCSSLSSVTIGNNVTSIEFAAFLGTELYNNTANWSNGVLYIGKYLIKADVSLSSAYTIKAGTKCIADYAFYECVKLTSVTLPNSVASIGSFAFEGCNSLTSIKIPNSVITIGSDAFNSCAALKSVAIPDSVTRIGNNAFYRTALYNSSANWTNGVLYIGKHLIKAENSLSGAYTIKSGTKCIADYAIYGCTKLTSVTIPNSVTNIGTHVFDGCSSLTSVTIPNSVTSIGDSAFYRCSSLTSVTIGNSVTSIGDSAFFGCTSLASVTIPASVTNIGDDAFADCDATIYCYKNSFAQTYAKDNGLRFVVIECAHTYKKVVEKATMTTNGKCYNQCTNCGAKGKKIRTIAKISTLKLSKTSYVYTGAVRKPTPIVRDANGNNLKLNADYKLKYSSGRKECGTYAVKVVFMGNYAGKKTLKFKIRLGKVTGITQQDSKGVYLTWNEVVGATRYEVWVYKEGYSKPKCMKSSTDTWIKNSNLTSGQVVKMEIRAVREVGGAVVGSSAVSYTAKAK